ncbi:hypothetical protein FDECE_10666 [Fusarium decemcellulare]|nr:hypothetical protein FDECE_10666 [Fusarium decemcellulare]
MPEPEFAQYTGVFRTKDAHRITRNRKPVSCSICQKRKSKCDRVKPCCGACQKRGDPEACVYGEASSSGLAGRQEMQVKVAKLEEIVKRLAAASEASGVQKSFIAPTIEDVGLKEIGDGSDVAYHGETSWEAVLQNIRDIQSVLNTEEEPEQLDEAENIPPPDIVLGSVTPITLDEICSSLPSRQDADAVINTYFGEKFLAVPFIHQRHFRRRYEHFWSKPHESNLLWVSIMFSILSLGAMIAKVKRPGLGSVAEPKFYMHRSAQCLITGEYLRAKPYSVEALMMFAHIRNVQKEDSDTTIWSLYGLGIRLAQRRGYHLDAARVSPNIKPFEAEMRRRTWFMVQSSDLLFSFQLGMPPMVYQEVCDAGHPRNLEDEDFDEDTDVPESRPPVRASPLLAWCIKSHLCRLLRRVLRHALAVEPAPYEETMRLQAELEAYYERIPPCYRIRPISETDPGDPGYTIMHRLILEVSFRKTLCVLHRPYLSVDKDNDRFKASRDICRDAALRILDLHLEFYQELRKDGRMHHDRYMLSSLTQHDFLVAAMIICLDLSESTDISPQDRQHRIQLLQRAYAIWNERGAKSKDSRHAAKVLGAILNRVDTPTTSSSETVTLADEMPTTDYVYGAPVALDTIPDLAAMPMPDYSVSYPELLPLDNFLGPTEGFDWLSIDQYLRSGNVDEPQPLLGLPPDTAP